MLRILFTGILLPSAAFCQQFDKPLPEEHRTVLLLKGPVTKLIEHTIIPPKDSSYYIDRQDFATEQWLTESRKEWNFDTQGNLQHATVEVFNPMRNTRISSTERKLSYHKGKLNTVVQFNGNDRGDSVIFHYKRNGLPEYYKLFNNKNKLQYTVTYTYNGSRQLTMARKKDEGNMPVAMIKYRYDNKTLKQTQYFDNQFRHTETHNYSHKEEADGTILESTAVVLPGNVMKNGISVVKDKKGNTLERSIINNNREVTDYRKYVYDTWGNQTEEQYFQPQKTVLRTVYTYDQQNNWIRKAIYTNDWLDKVVLRTLTYADQAP
jgi:hypothetical protein